MPFFEMGGVRVEVDEDGFIINGETWSESVASAMALADGISELTEKHWKVINYLREYYQKFGIAPTVRKLCKETGLSLAEMYELYPAGPAQGACKIAGLCKPTGCV